MPVACAVRRRRLPCSSPRSRSPLLRAPEASDALRDAGDRMLRAVIFHSDHLELSEQFDGVSGYEKSVTNLSWSYAAFVSAVRGRTGKGVAG